MSIMDLPPDEFLDKFKNASLPFGCWNHKAHLRMAFLIITNYAPDYKSAFHEIKTGINHFNSFHKEKLTVGYHETITRFWFEMIVNAVNKKLATGVGVDFDTFLNENPELLQTELIKDFLFKNPRARNEWVLPDLTSLPFGPTQQ